MADARIALQCTNLTHRYGGRIALDDISLTMPAGQFTVLLGLNGAGKTTLISLAAGLYRAQHGSIELFGLNLQRHPLRALATIGVVFQQLTTDLDLTVGQNLFYHSSLHGLSRSEARVRITEELGRLHLLDRLNDRVRTLSGGMRRSVEIARALLHRPKLLLLDEPTAGLDMSARKTILGYVRTLCRFNGTTALWTTHLVEEIEDEDLVIVLRQGRLVACERAEGLFGPGAGGKLVAERFTTGDASASR